MGTYIRHFGTSDAVLGRGDHPINNAAYATAPALMYVGLLMLGNVTKLDFNDSVDALSGMLCAVFIVLTCNIVTGIMLGFVALVVGRLFAAEWKKLNIGTVIIAVALVIFYAGGWAI